jgi:phage tail tape-measure protein
VGGGEQAGAVEAEEGEGGEVGVAVGGVDVVGALEVGEGVGGAAGGGLGGGEEDEGEGDARVVLDDGRTVEDRASASVAAARASSARPRAW